MSPKQKNIEKGFTMNLEDYNNDDLDVLMQRLKEEKLRRDLEKKEQQKTKRKDRYHQVTKKVKKYQDMAVKHKKLQEIREEVLERNRAFFELLSEGDQEYLLNARVFIDVQFNNDKQKRTYNQVKEYNQVVKKKDAERIERELRDRAYFELVVESPVYSAKVKGSEVSLTKLNKKPTNAKQVKMKDAYAVMVDGEEEQPWDRKKGTCVHDYLIYMYGGIKGFKKSCTYETLDHIFRDYDAIENSYMHQESTLEVGVTTAQIELFCAKHCIPMYALDQDNFYFHVYEPPKRNHHAPSLVFKMMNNHFYPIMQDLKKKRSLVVSIANHITQSDIIVPQFAKLEDDEKRKVYDNCHVFEDIDDPMTILTEIISKTGTVPANKQIHYNGQLTSFVFENELYIINQDANLVKKIYENIKKHKSLDGHMNSHGHNINSALFDVIKHVAKVDIPKSQPNPHVYKTLIQESVKSRIHYGCVNGYTQKDILRLMKSNDAICCDISKCYSKCMYDPYDEWIVLGFNDVWEPFSGSFCELGLYYVETNDTSLLHGSNIYTNTILMKAQAENIDFTVTKQLIPEKKAPKQLFQPILNAIKKVAEDDKEIVKKMNNMLSGYLGKTFKMHYRVGINQCLDDVWNWFSKHGMLESRDIFVKPIEYGNNQRLYLYGQEFKSALSEINVPMYIQIKDYANIRLYDMIKTMGGELAFRKVDCAVTIGGTYPELSNEWGGYRESEPPKQMGYPRERHAEFEHDDDWVLNDENDSADWESIMKVAIKNKGLLIEGRAGTGKSYCANQIAKHIKKVSKIAFTNKAALNIKGKTIHKFLKMDMDGNISKELIDKIKGKIECIIVDEISMINKKLWKRLVEVKRATNAMFILIGDHRQCAPVENENYNKIDNYFNHPAVKYLANYNKVELTVRHRYDEQLWNLLEDVEVVDVSKFQSKVHKRNICFYNSTRTEVNKMLMNQFKPDNATKINELQNDEYSQDVYIYQGLPVIARKTMGNGDVMVNNETFTITSIVDDEITFSTTRPDENNKPSEHTIKCKVNEFQKLFLVNYCSTTHKTQGETIVENFTIWDWDKMDKRLKYTAMSRAKKPEQISFCEMKKLSDQKLNPTLIKLIQTKIASHESYDNKHGYNTDIDVNYIISLLEKQYHTCTHCHEDIKLTCFNKADPKQFSIDRINDNEGHVKGNVVISCWECNRKHENKKL